ncbi:MAG: class I SAM-dependent methyltransferase [bacterium]
MNLVDEETAKLQAFVERYLSALSFLKVLEAGCGSLTHIRLSRDAYIVGIDISEEQLSKNKILKEAICADVQTHDFPEASFDMIVCWNVLEHLKYPEEALERFYTALKEDGILLINSSNPICTKGIFTKITPYRFHIWFYRVVRGWKEAGRDGNPPFPAYMRLSIRPKAMKRFGSARNITVVYESIFGHGDSRDIIGYSKTYVTAVVKILSFVIRLFTLGEIHPRLCQYILVLKKEPV